MRGLKIQRDGNELTVLIDGIAVRLSHEWDLITTSAIFSLSGKQFERFKSYCEEQEGLIDVFYKAVDACKNDQSGLRWWASRWAEHDVPYGWMAELLRSGLLTQEEAGALAEALSYARARAVSQARKEARLNSSTCIYLMKDERTRFVKIGRSKQPRFRESTLQSENPLITLIAFWPGKVVHETNLHRAYSEYRVRGEWFNLSDEQINEIIVRVRSDSGDVVTFGSHPNGVAVHGPVVAGDAYRNHHA